MLVRLVLIRHGATAWSVTGEHTGRSDIPLSAQGREQLGPLDGLVRAVLADQYDAAAVYSSPLDRALTSARLVVGPARDVTVDERLVEYDYGEYEGLRPDEIRATRPTWDIWVDGCPGGESVEDVGQRLGGFLTDVAARHSTVVVFAHSHVIRIMAALSVGLVARKGHIFTLDTASLSVIDDIRGKRVIQHWNLRPQ